MNTYSKIAVPEIQVIAEFISENRNNPEKVIAEFGKVSLNNGYGTEFLVPYDPIFKVIWVFVKNSAVNSVGLGGPSWEFTLSQLYSYFGHYEYGYERYDEEYVYVFYKHEIKDYAIKISSKIPVMEQDKILKDICVNEIVIKLR